MLRDALKKELKGKRVGINGSFMPYNTYKSLSSKIKAKFVDVSEQMLQARLVKDEAELKKMRRAVSITKKALAAGKSALKVGMTETQVAAAIDSTMLAHGRAPAFTSIVAFDSNSALPHHAPGGAKLKPNGIVLLRHRRKVDNYCGDMTRTFMFRPDRKSEKYKRFTEMYDVVSEAQRLGLNEDKGRGPGRTAAHRSGEVHQRIQERHLQGQVHTLARATL